MEEDDLKQLKAYKVGYDLGWYRAFEAISQDLNEIADAILNSATFKEIEREHGAEPIFLAKIMNIIHRAKEMRDENLPILLTERKAITALGAGLRKALTDNPRALDTSNPLNMLTAPKPNPQLKKEKLDDSH